MPDCAITTDIIVGFPGETEEDFAQTLEVCEEVGYDGAFTFVFSPRRGTEAATITEGLVPHEVKVERMERLVEVVQRRAHERAQRFVGRTLDVLVEGPSRTDASRIRGRSRHGKTVNFTGLAAPGEIVAVEIHSATSTTLAGEESLLSRAAAVAARRRWRASAVRRRRRRSAPSARRAAVQSAGGHELLLCARRPLDARRRRAPRRLGGRRHGAAAHRSRLRRRPADWVLLAVKAHQTPARRAGCRRCAGRGTRSPCCRTASTTSSASARWSATADVLPVVNWCPVEPVAPGRVRQRDALRLAVPAGAAGEGLAALLGAMPR